MNLIIIHKRRRQGNKRESLCCIQCRNRQRGRRPKRKLVQKSRRNFIKSSWFLTTLQIMRRKITRKRISRTIHFIHNRFTKQCRTMRTIKRYCFCRGTRRQGGCWLQWRCWGQRNTFFFRNWSRFELCDAIFNMMIKFCQIRDKIVRIWINLYIGSNPSTKIIILH